jgi:Tol biopolymer transport system component
MLGKTVGHYQILGMLGAGGMGVVYRAQDLKLGREVALKFLPANVPQIRMAKERFEREARAAAVINHPNICTVHEVGEYEGSPFIAMELLEGETLKQRIGSRPVPLSSLLDWAIQITEGLDAAHERRILHRDIKPANLFITSRGRVKILDFGLAKQSPAAGAATLDLITDPGTAAGTPNYMSPEQARGEHLDSRTDLFSLGAVLYEMATAKTPFQGATTGAVLGAILHERPESLLRLSPGMPAELDRIVSKALEKDRDLRYQGVADLRADLKRLLRDTSSGRTAATSGSLTAAETATLPAFVPVPPAEKKPRPKLMFAGIAAVALTVAIGGYDVIGRRGAASFQTMTIERLTNVGQVWKAAISPDGKYLAFVTGAANQPSLWVRQVATRSDLQILPAAAGTFEGLTFSRDANYIYYVLDQGNNQAGQLFRVATLGGEPQRILSGVDSPVAWSPDGNRFAFLRQTASERRTLMIARLDGSPEQAIAERTAPDQFTGYGASWSPDGKLISVSAYSGGKCYVMIVPAAGGRLQPLASGSWTHIRQLAWMADSNAVILISTQSNSSPGQIWRISYPGGQTRRITNDLNNYVDLSLTADSQTLVAVQGEVVSDIWRASDADGSRATQLTFGAGTQDGIYGLDWTAAGRMVYASLSAGTRELWTAENGARPRQITTDADLGFFSMPSVCPDGHTIVYGAGRLGNASIWRVDSESRRPEALVSSGTNGGPICSPDGKWVYFNSLAKYYTLWRIPLAGGAAEQLTQFPSTFPHVSPDGKWIAYLVADPMRSAFGIIPATGGPPAKTIDVSYSSPGGDAVIRWSPTGEAIDYVDTRDGVSNIWRQPINGESPQRVTNFNSGLIFNFVWLPGGRDLLIARGSAGRDVVRIRNFEAR